MDGTRKYAWAVKSRSAEGTVTAVSYSRHATPEEAIRAYEQATGRPWAEHAARGAEVVRVEVVEIEKPPSP